MAQRTCLCGCGASLEGRRPGTRYASDVCRQRGHRAGLDDPESAEGDEATDLAAALLRAKVRKETAHAELAELELERERGKVVPVKDAEDRIARFVASVRAQLLAVIGDVRQELPALTREQVATVDSIVRRRLEITAESSEAGQL